MRYPKHITATPQTEPLVGESQVKNNAGGYVFAVTKKTMLERFLMLGSEGGTFYVSEQKLTQENAKNIIEMVKENGIEVVNTILEVSKASRAPKQDPAIFALALCTTYGDQRTKNAAYSAIASVCRTSTHLFTFCQFIQDLRGWSRGLRRGINNWYASKTPDQLGYQFVKYRQRNGWSHQDVMRLSHPKPQTGTEALFSYVADKLELPQVEQLPANVLAFEEAQRVTNALELAKLIETKGLTWEMVPNEMLNQPVVLNALLMNMPLTAMLRNLNRFAQVGITREKSTEATQHIVKSLTNQRLLIPGAYSPDQYPQHHEGLRPRSWLPWWSYLDAKPSDPRRVERLIRTRFRDRGTDE
jgi:60 kDa SS-A/Ro ribonucleoprotein